MVGEIRRAPAVQRQARQRCEARARARKWKEKPGVRRETLGKGVEVKKKRWKKDDDEEENVR